MIIVSFIMSNCKKEMELDKEHLRKQSCYNFCHSVPLRISNGVEHFFYLLGIKIARNPIKWILGCSIIILICILGLFRFRQEKNPVKLWNPSDAKFVLDTEWLMSHYEEALRIQTFILTSNNILEQQALIKLNELTTEMISAQVVTDKISWTDVCMKVPTISNHMNRKKRQISLFDDFFNNDFTSIINDTNFEPVVHINTKLYCDTVNSLPKACLIFSILDIWNFDSAEIAKDTTDEIIEKINTVRISPTLGHSMNFTELLGGITLDEKGRIISATAVKTNMMVHVNFVNVDMEKLGNAAGTADDWATEDVLEWELAFLEVAKNISNKLQNEKDENSSLMFYYEAARSYGDISGTSIFQDIDKLALGTVLMFLYVLIILSKANWVEWRFSLTVTGLLCVGCAFITAVGICSLIGIPYGPIHTSLPFLLLGLGIDDIFVFMASWKKIHTDESILNKPLIEKIGFALGHAGSAISVTSFTDIVAFMIGASTILPSLQSFCIYAAVGVFVTYLMQITFFIGCFTLDAKRIEKKRNGALPCIVHEKFTLRLPDPRNALSWRFINALYSRVIFTMPGKVIIILVTIVTMSVSVVGSLQLKQWFDPLWLLPKESYLKQYTDILQQEYPHDGFDAFYIMGDNINYPSEFPKIISLTENLKNTSFVEIVHPWPTDFARFVSTYYKTDLRTTKVTNDDFYHYLSKFLVSRAGGRYQRNFLFNETFTCGKSALRILVATIDFKFVRFSGPHQWIPAMDSSRDIANEAQIHGFVTVWCRLFGPWTADKLIAQEVIRNVILALICVMGTTAILIAELQTCCWILLCVVLTMLNVCGFMYFWGLTIDIVSCIGLELGIGLSVDYAAHVAHAFLNAESQPDDRDARTTRALIAVRHIGAAVAYGAGSTLLAVSMLGWSTSYVFMAFFKIFFLVIVFGIWHGLLFLPVVLSIIGPASLRVAQQPQPMSEKAAMTDDEN